MTLVRVILHINRDFGKVSNQDKIVTIFKYETRKVSATNHELALHLDSGFCSMKPLGVFLPPSLNITLIRLIITQVSLNIT